MKAGRERADALAAAEFRSARKGIDGRYPRKISLNVAETVAVIKNRQWDAHLPPHDPKEDRSEPGAGQWSGSRAAI
jgi:hypothetical protein